MPIKPFVLGALVAAVIAPAAWGQEGQTPERARRPTPELEFVPEWRVRVEPAAGFFAFSGDLQLPAPNRASEADAFDVEDINLDRAKLAPFSEIHIAREKWRITFSGLSLSVEGDDEAPTAGQIGDFDVVAGQSIESELTYITAGFRAGYRVWSWVSGTDATGAAELSLGIDALAGLRMHNVDTETTVAGAGTTSADETFVDVLGGARLELDWKRTLAFDLYATGGGLPAGDRTSRSFNLGLGFTYRPIPTVGALVGYRLTAFNLENDDGAETFEYDGALAGVYWGVQLSF